MTLWGRLRGYKEEWTLIVLTGDAQKHSVFLAVSAVSSLQLHGGSLRGRPTFKIICLRNLIVATS